MKQTEWYTLKIQYPISKADVEILHGNNKSLCWLYEHDGCRISHLNADEFPVSWLIPIEDKPITAEDYIMETAITSDVEMQDIKDAFKAGEKNQWINHEKLRMEADGYLLIVNALEYSLRDVPLSVDEVFKRTKHAFEEALKNIKPLT